MQITKVDIAIIIDISKCGLSGLAARTSTSCCRALRRMDNQCWRTLSRVQSPVGAQNNYNYNYVLSIPAEAEREGTLVTNSAITRRIYPHYTGLGSAFHSVVTHTIPTLPFLCFKCSDEGARVGRWRTKRLVDIVY